MEFINILLVYIYLQNLEKQTGMFDQLLKIAQENLGGITRNIPGLNDLDSKQVSDVTSQTVIDTILQQAKKGNIHSLKEMLSGADTPQENEVIDNLKGPVTNQLQNKLNISDQSAKQLAIMALPIIMNMLNSKVRDAQNTGFDINAELNSLNGKGAGMLNSILGLFGGNNGNNKVINNLLERLIR